MAKIPENSQSGTFGYLKAFYGKTKCENGVKIWSFTY